MAETEQTKSLKYLLSGPSQKKKVVLALYLVEGQIHNRLTTSSKRGMSCESCCWEGIFQMESKEGQRQKTHGARGGLNDHGVQGTPQKPEIPAHHPATPWIFWSPSRVPLDQTPSFGEIIAYSQIHSLIHVVSALVVCLRLLAQAMSYRLLPKWVCWYNCLPTSKAPWNPQMMTFQEETVDIVLSLLFGDGQGAVFPSV